MIRTGCIEKSGICFACVASTCVLVEHFRYILHYQAMFILIYGSISKTGINKKKRQKRIYTIWQLQQYERTKWKYLARKIHAHEQQYNETKDKTVNNGKVAAFIEKKKISKIIIFGDGNSWWEMYRVYVYQTNAWHCSLYSDLIFSKHIFRSVKRYIKFFVKRK